MSDRIPCLVPFCRRTADAFKYPEGTEIICAKHWRLVPRATKARRRQVQRRLTRIKAVWDFDGPRARAIEATGRYIKYCVMIQRAFESERRLWERCKAQAIESAGGLR